MEEASTLCCLILSWIFTTSNNDVFARVVEPRNLLQMSLNVSIVPTNSLDAHHSATRIPLRTSVADLDGINAFQSVSIRDLRNTTTQTRKRTPPEPRVRKITSCPLGFEFLQSSCDYGRSPQAYQVTCQGLRDRAAVSFPGWCGHANEFCFDNMSWDAHYDQTVSQGMRFTAYCITLGQYLKFKRRSYGSKLFEDMLMEHVVTSAMSLSEMQVLLTDSAGTSTVKASDLSMEAQMEKTVYNTHIWGTLPGGVMSCTNCARASLPRIPARTQRVHLNVGLPPEVDVARLYYVILPKIP